MDDLLPGLIGAPDMGSGDPSSPPSVPIPPVDEDNCALLGGTGLIVQAVMGLLVLASLLYKRHRENPRRPWPVWLADVGKQVIGQGFLHSTNVLFSTLLSQHDEKRNACTAYFLSIFVDCTLGVLIIYSALRIFSYVLIQRMHLKGYRSGQYYEKPSTSSTTGADADADAENGLVYDAGAEESNIHNRGSNDIDDEESRSKPSPPAMPDQLPMSTSSSSDEHHPPKPPFQWSWWGKQLLVYLASLVVMKLAILGFFWIPAIFEVGDWLLSWLGDDTKIVFVLMIFPLAMNALQFLLIDTILKSKTPFSDATPAEGQGSGGRHSRRGSRDRDRGHSGEEDEGRAFLSDNTHDDLEAGTPLPSYQSQGSVHSESSKNIGGTQSHQERHQPAPARMNSSGSRSNPAATIPYGVSSTYLAVEKSALNAIPLKVVSQQHHPSVLSLRSEKTDNDDGEANGWDWLSEDGNVPSRQSEDGGWNHHQQTQDYSVASFNVDSAHINPIIKTAKVA